MQPSPSQPKCTFSLGRAALVLLESCTWPRGAGARTQCWLGCMMEQWKESGQSLSHFQSASSNLFQGYKQVYVSVCMCAFHEWSLSSLQPSLQPSYKAHWFSHQLRGFVVQWSGPRAAVIVFGFHLVAQLVKNPPAMWEVWVPSSGWEDSLEEEGLPTPVFCPEEFHGLVCGAVKNLTLLSDFHSLTSHATEWLSKPIIAPFSSVSLARGADLYLIISPSFLPNPVWLFLPASSLFSMRVVPFLFSFYVFKGKSELSTFLFYHLDLPPSWSLLCIKYLAVISCCVLTVKPGIINSTKKQQS